VKPLVFANFLAPNMTSVYSDVAARVGRALGAPARLIEGNDLEQLRDGSVVVAFLCGLPYVRLCAERPGMLRPLAAPILDEARYEDRPVYFSDVIVRRDSPFRAFGDLRGRSWSWRRRTFPTPCKCGFAKRSARLEMIAPAGTFSPPV
jgi:phosphonate transport system substrate-binding protein